MTDETPFQTPPTTDPIPPAPIMPSYVPKPKPPILPIIFGFLIVLVVSASVGIAYYKAKLTSSTTPSPSPTISPTPPAEPSPIATPSATPKSSFKPVSVTLTTPSATPVAQPTLDIRFGNPSANVKQTIDEGKGDGRVINREYTSIQAGQFDEVKSSWSPRVTVCFHFVTNEVMSGKDLKFSFSLDDKVEVSDNLGQYDKLEVGRLYDWCHDVTTNLGKHTAKILLNPDKSLKESNYTNDLARIDYENLADKIAPNFTLIGPNNEGASGTCVFPQYISDNVTSYADLKIEQKIDAGEWTKFIGDRYCFTGASGSSHTYVSRITDTRGNVNEQSKSFVLY